METLFDAIINIKDLIQKKIKLILRFWKDTKNFFISRRFTRQKNFIYLIREFGKFLKLYQTKSYL